jgi:hypothetical protein
MCVHPYTPAAVALVRSALRHLAPAPLLSEECGVQSLQFVQNGILSRGSGFREQGAGFKGQVAGCKVQGAGYRVQGAGYRVPGTGSGCKVQGTGFKACAAPPLLPIAQKCQ